MAFKMVADKTVKLTFELLLFLMVTFIEGGLGQQEPAAPPVPPSCYGAGSIAAAVLLTFFGTLLVIGGLVYFWKRREDAKKVNHLILETDPERGGKAEYAFDNPGFKDTTNVITTNEKLTKPDSSTNKTKWTHWSPLAALNLKPEKKRALDDSALQPHEVKAVALKSQDFTGLGFNICGNMKEGIYIKDILHRGPAFESGRLNPGDRINNVTISFEHMVLEDALNILSYASPYEVIIEAKSGARLVGGQPAGPTLVHPIYRCSSSIDLSHPAAKKKLFGDDYSSGSNYSSLQKSRSNVTTLERKESKSPRPNQVVMRKSPQKLTTEVIKTQLEYNNSDLHQETNELMQKSENRGHKFGIRVLPPVDQQQQQQQKSPKVLEQNQNNMNIEKNKFEEEMTVKRSIDEVDDDKVKVVAPQARKREKKSPEPAFERNNSGIKRDLNGIPLEIPEHLQDVALMARRNRKSSMENGLEEQAKKKGKAPSPPPTINFTLGGGKSRAFEDLSSLSAMDRSEHFDVNTDSEDDVNNMSSVNTIELNASDITVHQAQQEEGKSRKTASTGDLTKMKKTPRSNTGTLERAQSLDITSDTSGPGLGKIRTYDATENLLIDREPRLSLILDGLNTFQRNKLKTSTEWGNLEDAILSFKDEEERRKSEPQFNAVMDKVIQIKRESREIEVIPDEVLLKHYEQVVEAPKVINKLWPDEEELVAPPKRLQAPTVPERTKLKLIDNETSPSPSPPQPTERVVSKIDLTSENATTTTIPSLLNQPNTNLQVEFECIKPVPPKRERTPEKETVINLNEKIGVAPIVTSFEKNNIMEMCSQIARGRKCNEGQLIKDEWEVDVLNNTSPPSSMTLMDEVMDSYNKNFVVKATNLPDDTKTVKNLTANFISNEIAALEADNTNVPDDVKVSRGTYESLESRKCDDAKSEDLVSHVTVNENGGGSNLHSLELSINEANALDSSGGSIFDVSNDVTVIVSRPNSVTVKKIEADSSISPQVVAITESSFSKVTKGPDEIPVNISETKLVKIGEGSHQDDFKVEITESKYSTFEVDGPHMKALSQDLHLDEPIIEALPISTKFKNIDDESPVISLIDDEKKTYITEIQVTNNSADDRLENAFENYVKNFERKLETFESNMQNFENNLEEFIRDEPKSIVLEEKGDDVEKQVSKIQEIAEEQLKTLPEMKFTTSSYEGDASNKTPEKRHSFELLRSNFEKPPDKRRDSTTPPKSRIPISTTMKTPPISPERRDSRNLENENDKAILELMSSSSIHSNAKNKPANTKNVSVTSIRNNSKIPSGLPTLTGRPPIPPRKSEENNGGMESSFKQWVFNPNSNVTNVTVGKEK